MPSTTFMSRACSHGVPRTRPRARLAYADSIGDHVHHLWYRHQRMAVGIDNSDSLTRILIVVAVVRLRGLTIMKLKHYLAIAALTAAFAGAGLAQADTINFSQFGPEFTIVLSPLTGV